LESSVNTSRLQKGKKDRVALGLRRLSNGKLNNFKGPASVFPVSPIHWCDFQANLICETSPEYQILKYMTLNLTSRQEDPGRKQRYTGELSLDICRGKCVLIAQYAVFKCRRFLHENFFQGQQHRQFAPQ
jgi:hypothetical protein